MRGTDLKNVLGVKPLTVTYLRQKDQTEMMVTVDAIGESSSQSNPTLEHITVPVSLKKDAPGHYFFKILQVTDALNNSVYFEPTWKFTDRSPIHVTTGKEIRQGTIVECKGRGDRSLLALYAQPRVKFAANQYAGAGLALRMKEGKASRPIPLGVEMWGSPPFTIGYEYRPLQSNTSIADQKSYQNHVQVFDERYDLLVDQPGTYQLTSISDSFCQEKQDQASTSEDKARGILEPSHVRVDETVPPTFQVVDMPLEESCVGKIGLTFDITLTGQSPWYTLYCFSFTFLTRHCVQVCRIHLHP
jgi:hypothetical protein